MKKSLSLTLSLIMIITTLCALPFTAHAALGGICDNFSWSLAEGELRISPEGEGIVDEYPWESYKNIITDVVINEGINEIMTGLFDGYTSIETVVIPSTCKRVEDESFHNCTALEEIMLREGVEEIGQDTFCECSALETVELPSTVKTLDYRAFKDCTSLNDVGLNSGLQVIQEDAFYGCTSLKGVIVPATVTTLGDNSLGYYYDSGSNKKVTNFIVGGCGTSGLAKNYADSNGFTYWDVYNISMPVGKDDKYTAVFNEQTGLLKINYNGNTSARFIGRYWAVYADKIKSVEISGNIKEVEPSAFIGCSNLTSVKLGNKIETVYPTAFANCPKLKSITIPDSVTDIWSLAFGYVYNESEEEYLLVDGFTIKSACSNAAVKTYVENYGTDYNGKKLTWSKTHSYDNGKITSTTDKTYTKTFTCTGCTATKKTTYNKKSNTLTVKAKKPTVKYSKLKKKNQTIARKNAITVSKAKGTLTYSKSSGNKKITINKKTGKITVKKGLKKGTYKVKIKVTAAGNNTYKKGTKTVTVTIKVK